MTGEPLDLITIGRIGIDLYPLQQRTRLAEVTSFRKLLGGSPTNVSVAAARLGHRSAVVTKVGDDPFGESARAALRGFGVDDRWVGVGPGRTPLAFCEMFPPDNFPILFYRGTIAPDLTLTESDLPEVDLHTARVLWTTGTGLSRQPSRETTLTALRRRGRSGIVVHDLDFRPELWSDPAEAGRQGRLALAHATVAVGNRAEVATVVGGDLAPEEAAPALLDLGVDLAIVKLGPAGVLAATRSEVVRVPAIPVDVVNGLGAGDAFGGALCHGLLAGWSLRRTIRFANAAGAVVAARLGCADDMPTEHEVLSLLGDTPATPPSHLPSHEVAH